MFNNGNLRKIRILLAALFLVLSLVCFSGFGAMAAYVMHFECAPAILSWISGASLWAIALVLVQMMIARFCGRVYCSVLCPLGILQDVTGVIPLAKNSVRRDFANVRLFIAGAVGGLLFSASAAGFFFLDPYSIFGRGVSSFLWGGTIPLAVILLVTLFKRRAFCTYICPVGTLLGTLSRNSMWQLKIADNCVNCGKCVKVCPAGCVEPGKKVLDNERCLRCMECVSACPVKAIGFERIREQTSVERRNFIIRCGWAFGGFVVGFIFSKTGIFSRLFKKSSRSGIYPPGAAKFELFERKCTGCLLCTKVCPQKIIVPAKNGIGPVELDLSNNYCRYDCNRCGNICPTGAIRKLPLPTKQKLKIAQAKFAPTVCIVFQEGVKCGKCAKACPAGAVTLRKSGAPRFNAKHCIGCGACHIVCPTKAFTIEKISEQVPIGNK